MQPANDPLDKQDIGLVGDLPVAKYSKKSIRLFGAGFILLMFLIYVFTNQKHPKSAPPKVQRVASDYTPKIPTGFNTKISYDSTHIQAPMLGPERGGEIGEGIYQQQLKSYAMVNADKIQNVSDEKSSEHQLRLTEYQQELELKALELQNQAINSDLVLTSTSGGGGSGSAGKALLSGLDPDVVAPSEYDAQNGQADKLKFLANGRHHQPDDNGFSEEAFTSPYTIVSSTLIPCNLLSAINSDLPGPLEAQVRENVYDSMTGKHLLIPQGARLTGEYNSHISYGQDRLQVVFTRIIFPPSKQHPYGYSVKLESFQGSDLSGYNGLNDRVNHHFGRIFSGAVLTSILSATSYNKGGERLYPRSHKQMMAEGIGSDLNQIGQEFVRKQMNRAATITVRAGMPFNVKVMKDLILNPR